jgi:hypothetical protein
MKIGAKNFQGITSYQEIEIEKLCLLYGKNSSGKSSILDAIRVGKDLHEKGSAALPKKWMSSIPTTQREGEVETVLLFEERNAISFDDWYRDTLRIFFYPQEDFLPLKLLWGSLSQVEKIAIQIKWASPESSPSIVGYKVLFDGSPVLTWSRGNDRVGKGTIHKNHDFIANITIFSEDNPWEASSMFRSCTQNTSEDFGCNFDIYSFHDSVNFVLDSEEHIISKQDDLVLFLFMFLISGISYWLSLALDFDEVPEIRTTNNIPFSQKDLLSKNIDKSRYHEAILNIYAFESEFGEYKESYRQDIDLINEFLSSEKYLNSGFKIEAELRYHMTQKLIDECREAPPDTITNFLSDLEPEHITTKLALRDIVRNSLVDLDDVGVGVSQVIPVITAAAIRQKAYIQQPELHLHPKMQASIADVFIAALNMQRNPYLSPPIFILETHSELLALRVLRRICETNRAQIKDRKLELNPDSVSIIYVDKNDKGETTLTKLRISEAGEFLDRWPDGFFAERDAELFYD